MRLTFGGALSRTARLSCWFLQARVWAQGPGPRPSADTQSHRGFFSCLGRGGQLYDDLKYVWLQGRQVGISRATGSSSHSPAAARGLSRIPPDPLRQVWVYCHLYRKLERFRRPELLEAATAGVCPKPRWPNEPAPRPPHG